MAKKGLFKLGGSSEHSSLRVASDSPCRGLRASNLKKPVPSTTSAVIHGGKKSCQDDSAIESDNSDWEDSNGEDNIKSGVDETMVFQRIKSKAKPPPKRESLITLALQPAQNRGLTPQSGHVVPESIFSDVQRPRTLFSPTKRSLGESDEASVRIRQKPTGAPTQSPNDVVHSSAQPIPLTSNGADEPVVCSPMTNRCKMVATELPEPICRQILRERKTNTSPASAVPKRLHKSGTVTTLDQYPHSFNATKGSSDIDASSWERDLIWDTFAGYHTRGW